MDEIIVIDTETTTDPTQRFTFGSFQYGIRHRGKFTVLTEGLIYADDIDPKDLNILRTYAETHPAHVDLSFVGNREPNWNLQVLSRSQFVERWLWDIAYQRQATVIGFNLPFDLSRLAIAVGEARKPFTDGFSFTMFRYQMRPRLRIKHLSSTKSFIGWTYGNVPDGKAVKGRFVDLRTASFALTNRKHTLASACDAFNCDIGKYDAVEHGVINYQYIDYNRNDVSATWNLYCKIITEFEKHPLGITLDRVYSPASISKAYYLAMGMVPPLEKFKVPDEIMGQTMAAFFGARTECMIRRTPVPVTVLDFTSMYPTVNSLMRLWFLLTAQSVTVEDSTSKVQWLLDTITLEDCFNASLWPHLVGYAKVRPDNDILPIRARYGTDSSYNIGINYVTSDQPLYYALPDLVASKILTGRSPQISEARTFVGHGTDAKLRTVRLRGETLIEPKSTDFFTWVIEKRATVKDTPLGDFLKVMANAGSYGIFAEMNRDDSRENQATDVWSADVAWRTSVRHPERPGRFCFPPVAVAITAAARLMLAMLERCVTDAGGCWAFADTDSMAVVTDGDSNGTRGEIGRDIRGLSAIQISHIIDKFDTLSPYTAESVPHLLKTEFQGWCYAISAKRYALYQRTADGIEIQKYSQHGLGHLAGPYRGWESDLWKSVITGKKLKFGTLPTLSQWSVSTPSLYHTMRVWNHEQPYPEQVKPFNFVSAVYVRREHRPPGSKDKFQLIRPFSTDNSVIMERIWTNKYQVGSEYRITNKFQLMDDAIPVVTYADVAREYAIHPEPKSIDHEGNRAGIHTVGRLYRSHVVLAGLDYVGKESNKVEETVQGELQLDAVQLRITPKDHQWDQMRTRIFRVLRRYSDVENARLAGLSTREYRRVKTGETRPFNIARDKIIDMAVYVACGDLRRSPNLIKDARTLLMEWEVQHA